jgi:large subunit ribosomal protein L30
MNNEKTKKQLKVTLVRSTNKCLAAHKACVIGLGLRRLRHSVIVEDTPCIMGMVTKVNYLLKVEEQ